MAGWYFRDTPTMQRALHSMTQSTPVTAEASKDSALSRTPVTTSTSVFSEAPRAASPTRKCLREGVLVYTDGPCPSGTTEQKLDSGTISVIGGQRALVEAQKAAATNGNSDVDEAMPEMQAQRRKALEAAERAERLGKAVRP